MMDLAAAAGARGDSHESTMGRQCSWSTRTGATLFDWTDDYATAGSGPGRRVSPEHGTRRVLQVNSTRHVF